MKTDRLITILSENLQPVERLEMPFKTALKWLILTLATISIFVFMRSDHFRNIHIPVYSYEVFLLICLSIMSLLAIIRLMVPGNYSGYEKWIAISMILLWGILLLFRMNSTEASGSKSFEFEYHHCIADILFFALIPFLYLGILVKKGAILEPGSTMLLIGIASLSFSAASIQLLCPNESPMHLLRSHFLPVILVSVIALFFGRISFRW